MRIVVVTGIFPPDHGGPASYVPVISGELVAQGHEVLVVTLSDRLDIEAQHPFGVTRIARHQSRLLRTLKVIWTIWTAALRADVLYLNGLVLEGTLAGLLSGTPFVTKVVGDLVWERATRARETESNLDDFQWERLPLYWRLMRTLQSWYTAKASWVVVPSGYLGRVVSGWGVPAARTRVIFNAVQPFAPVGVFRKSYDVVTVGRLVPWKGVRELMDVCADLRLSLRIVGDGPLRRELETHAATLQSEISFAGHVEHSGVAAEISRGRVFVLNSSYEGLPHIVLEAKLAGVPVLATAAGGTAETITHEVDGWLVPVGDRGALSDGLARLIADPALCQRLAASADLQVRTQFSFAMMVEQTVDVLSRAAARELR